MGLDFRGRVKISSDPTKSWYYTEVQLGHSCLDTITE